MPEIFEVRTFCFETSWWRESKCPDAMAKAMAALAAAQGPAKMSPQDQHEAKCKVLAATDAENRVIMGNFLGEAADASVEALLVSAVVKGPVCGAGLVPVADNKVAFMAVV